MRPLHKAQVWWNEWRRFWSVQPALSQPSTRTRAPTRAPAPPPPPSALIENSRLHRALLPVHVLQIAPLRLHLHAERGATPVHRALRDLTTRPPRPNQKPQMRVLALNERERVHRCATRLLASPLLVLHVGVKPTPQQRYSHCRLARLPPLRPYIIRHRRRYPQRRVTVHH